MFGVLTAITTVPGIIATTEAVRQGQRQNARDEHRGRRSHLVVHLPERNMYSERFDGAFVILRNGKLYVDTARNNRTPNSEPLGHPFTGYFLPHPHNQSRWKGVGWRGEGLVSTISEDPPMLNWIYVDEETHEIRYGTRAETEGHRVGPWDVTPGPEKRMTFEGWEGFIAVEEEPEARDERVRGLWALYFDVDDDGLRGGQRVGTRGKRMLYVSVTRKERVITRDMAEEEREERLRRREELQRRNAEAHRVSDVRDVFRDNGVNGHAANGDGGVRETQVEEEIDE